MKQKFSNFDISYFFQISFNFNFNFFLPKMFANLALKKLTANVITAQRVITDSGTFMTCVYHVRLDLPQLFLALTKLQIAQLVNTFS